MSAAHPRNRYDIAELGGAFGDLGTLIPFVAAYVTLVNMDPAAILAAFGSTLIVAGWYYRTPFPVQPMKAIGTAAALQSTGIAFAPATVIGAGLVTGLIWLALGISGLGRRLARWVPRPALVGVVMGLGFSFMLEGIRMMAAQWPVAIVLLPLTLFLLARPRVPTMAVLLPIGAALAIWQDPGILHRLAGAEPGLRWPTAGWPGLTWRDIAAGTLWLALPQLPLTFGNAMMAITEENNRLFPDRPVSERKVALSTGLMNLWSSAIGGIPMCHGAGGMAGHVRFGARTGGASIMLGSLLLILGLFFADSVATLFHLFPPAVLGIILFVAGAELALGSRDQGTEKVDRFVILATAAFAIWNVGIAVVFGILAFHAAKRGWLKF